MELGVLEERLIGLFNLHSPLFEPLSAFWQHHTIKDLLDSLWGLKFLPCGIFMSRRSLLGPLHTEAVDESEVFGDSPPSSVGVKSRELCDFCLETEEVTQMSCVSSALEERTALISQ